MTDIKPSEEDQITAADICVSVGVDIYDDFEINAVALAIAEVRLQEREACAVICETYIECGAIAREIRSQS